LRTPSSKAMLSSAIVVSLSSSVLYFQRREDDAVAVSLHGLPALLHQLWGHDQRPD